MLRVHRLMAVSAFLSGLALIGLATAEDQPYTTEASFVGGAGSSATNADYELVSSWRQPTQTSISSGGPYDHASGFLGTQSDLPAGFRIISFGIVTNPTRRFEISIPTRPDHTYLIQFNDSVTGPPVWQSFANTNQTVGTFKETNAVPGNFTFSDDFTPATSGGTSPSALRLYRVISAELSPTP
jgi:hypothetical protein